MFTRVLHQLQPFAQEFARHGKQVYLVGGAVRNLLLGREVTDYDFTTDALPEEVQRYFPKVIPTGLQHGTVTVLFRGQPFEVTTFRVDGDYSDRRRPDAVRFTPSLEEDLSRRDFTINALALNLSTGLLADPHNGRGDLERGLLRAIGDPGKRFDEDALRLLRLFRFAAQLGFEIDPGTLAAVPSRRQNLRAVSRERVREELSKALAGVEPFRAWGPLADLGILDELFPSLGLRPLTDREAGVLTGTPADLRWSFWLTLAAGPRPDAWEVELRRLTMSNADIERILGPARAWSTLREGSPCPGAKEVIEAWGHRARVVAGLDYLRALEQAGFWNDEAGWCQEIGRAASSEEPIFSGELAVNGRDLQAWGMPPGPGMGKMIRQLLRVVWADPSANSPGRLREAFLSLR